jgi:hypothetical protein
MNPALAKLMAKMKTPALIGGGAAAGAGAMYGGDKLLDEIYPARRWVPKALQGPLMDAKKMLGDEDTQNLLLALGIPLATAAIPGAGIALERWRNGSGTKKTAG